MKRKTAVFVGVGASAIVAFVVIYLVLLNSPLITKPISDVELQKRTEQRTEVKALLSEYPNVEVQFNKNETIRSIDYFTVIDGSGTTAGFTYLLKINIFTDNYGNVKELAFTCSKSDGIDVESYTISENIEEDIRRKNCLRL